MQFNEYQKKSRKTAIYPEMGNNFVYVALGIAGEGGEISDKIKKIWRDKNKEIDEETKKELMKEMGDLLWYLSQLASELGVTFEEVVLMNLEKIASRQKREVLHGEGDNR